VDGNFATGPETKLLALRILRVPAASAIRGKLWISSIRLAPHKQQGNGFAVQPLPFPSRLESILLYGTFSLLIVWPSHLRRGRMVVHFYYGSRGRPVLTALGRSTIPLERIAARQSSQLWELLQFR
jgi:hypothetical protein